ncbi:MAG: hypothetical protein O3A58_04265 [Proteobacteria bacterium]|nr:hypothetical protein [Pseudomonadota bacterium]
MNTKDTLQNIIKYSQVLYSDGILYSSDDKAISTQERRNLVTKDIALIQEQIKVLENILNSNR